MPGTDPDRVRRRARGHPHRGSRTLPSLRRPDLPRRQDRPVADLAQGAADRSRDAADLERRRRDELRDARAGEPAPRVRSVASSPRVGSSSGARMPDEEIRTLDGTVRTLTTEDLVIADADATGRDRRGHGRRGQRGHGRDDSRPPRGRELRAERDPADLGAARLALGGLGPVGEGRRPASRRGRRRACAASSSPSSPAPAGPAKATSAAELPEPADHPPAPRAHLGAPRPRGRARRAAQDPRGAGVRGLRRLERHRADLARPRRHARSRPGRGSRPDEAGRGAVHAPVAPGDVRPAPPWQQQPARRRGRARRARLLRGLHAEPRGRRPGPQAPIGSRSRSRRTWPCSRTTLLPSLIQVARHNLDVGNERHRALRDRARLPAERRASCPTSASTSPASRRPHLRVRRAQSKRFSPPGGPSERSRAASIRCCIPARRRRRPAGSSAGSGPGSWRATGARSSSTSAPSSAERGAGRTRTSSPIRRSSRTLPLRCPTRCSRRIWSKLHARPCRSSGRWSPFDVYRGEQVGEGRKSIAFRVEFRSPERTLTDEEAAGLREKIVAALRERFGAELRA